MASTVDRIETAFSATGQGNLVGAFKSIGDAAGSCNRQMAMVNAGLVGLGSVAGAMSGLANQALATAKAVASFGMAGAATLAGGVAAVGAAALKTTADFQMLRATLDAVMGSSAKGEQAFQWAIDFAQTTPFQLREVIQLMTQMSAMQLNPFKDLKSIGDAALGNFERAQRVVTALGQMKTKGFVSGEELMQLQEAAIPATKILADHFKLTADQLKNIGELRLPADSAIAAILKATDRRFAGAMVRQMDTIQGKISSLMDAKDKYLNAIGTALAPTLMAALDKVSAWLSDRKNVEKGVKFFMGALTIAQMVAEVLQRAIKAFTESKGVPKFVYELELGLVRAARAYWRAISAIQTTEIAGAAMIGALKSGSTAGAAASLGAGAIAAAARAGIGVGVDKEIGRLESATKIKRDFARGMDWRGMFEGMDMAGFQGRYKKNVDEALKSIPVEAKVKVPAAAPVVPTVPASTTGGVPAANRFQQLVEQFIIGARGPIGQAGVKPMDLEGMSGYRTKAGNTIRVKLDGAKGPLHDAMEMVCQEYMTGLLKDPGARRILAMNLRAELGLA